MRKTAIVAAVLLASACGSHQPPGKAYIDPAYETCSVHQPSRITGCPRTYDNLPNIIISDGQVAAQNADRYQMQIPWEGYTIGIVNDDDVSHHIISDARAPGKVDLTVGARDSATFVSPRGYALYGIVCDPACGQSVSIYARA